MRGRDVELKAGVDVESEFDRKEEEEVGMVVLVIVGMGVVGVVGVKNIVNGVGQSKRCGCGCLL